MSTETTVSRNEERQRFEITTGDGDLAGYAEYQLRDGAREFTHTVVDEQYEGQGVGGALARGALDRTRDEGLGVVPTCSFIRGWIDKHPEYADLVVS